MTDWQPGDLALCVRRSDKCGCCGSESDVDIGGVYTVSGVQFIPYSDGPGMALFLRERAEVSEFIDSNGDRCFHAGYDPDHFRKIAPHTPDAEDEETLHLLNSTPAPVGV